MEHLVSWIRDLLYTLSCGIASLGLALFFIVIAIQFITKGRIDSGKAIGTVFKVLASMVKFVTAGAKRRR